MKAIYLLILAVFVQQANGQDFCKQIKKDISDDKTQADYSSPSDPSQITPIVIKRTVNTNPDWAVDNFFVVFQIGTEIDNIYTKTADGQSEKEEKTLVIEFDDKSKITDDTIKISHDFTDDRALAIRTVYYPITEDAAKNFTTKKITKFSLAGNDRTIPADSANAYMHYFQCIKSGK